MAFDWFWKAMGSSPTKNQKKSRAVVAQAGADRFAQATDEELRDHARSTIANAWPKASSGQRDAEDFDAPQPSVKDASALLAVLREAARRTLSMSPFDVQMQGTLRLLHGDVVEMATGEGKRSPVRWQLAVTHCKVRGCTSSR